MEQRTLDCSLPHLQRVRLTLGQKRMDPIFKGKEGKFAFPHTSLDRVSQPWMDLRTHEFKMLLRSSDFHWETRVSFSSQTLQSRFMSCHQRFLRLRPLSSNLPKLLFPASPFICLALPSAKSYQKEHQPLIHHTMLPLARLAHYSGPRSTLQRSALRIDQRPWPKNVAAKRRKSTRDIRNSV